MDWGKLDLGDQPAFALDPNPAAWRGMTYRQWLIGQALMGAMSNPDTVKSNFDNTALEIIAQVDFLLKNMQKKGTVQ